MTHPDLRTADVRSWSLPKARSWNFLSWDARTWRNNLRLTSGLVLLSFVICHLTAHCFLLVSLNVADVAFDITADRVAAATGTTLLLAAFLVHYANALWSIYVRQSLRLSPWQWVQIALGLTIPLLLMLHVIGTRIAESLLDANPIYQSVLLSHWLVSPGLAVVQTLAVLTVWIHACVGIHFWLRIKRWYGNWRPCSFRTSLAVADAGAGRLRRRRQRNFARQPKPRLCATGTARPRG